MAFPDVHSEIHLFHSVNPSSVPAQQTVMASQGACVIGLSALPSSPSHLYVIPAKTDYRLVYNLFNDTTSSKVSGKKFLLLVPSFTGPKKEGTFIKLHNTG